MAVAYNLVFTTVHHWVPILSHSNPLYTPFPILFCKINFNIMILTMDTVCLSKTLVSAYKSTCCYNIKKKTTLTPHRSLKFSVPTLSFWQKFVCLPVCPTRAMFPVHHICLHLITLIIFYEKCIADWRLPRSVSRWRNPPVSEWVTQWVAQSFSQSVIKIIWPVSALFSQSCHSVSGSVSQPVDQSVEQSVRSVSEWVIQWVAQSVIQSVDQSVDQPVYWSVSQRVIIQWVAKSVGQWINQSTNQCADQSASGHSVSG
jgi:hypothetical protein